MKVVALDIHKDSITVAIARAGCAPPRRTRILRHRRLSRSTRGRCPAFSPDVPHGLQRRTRRRLPSYHIQKNLGTIQQRLNRSRKPKLRVRQLYRFGFNAEGDSGVSRIPLIHGLQHL